MKVVVALLVGNEVELIDAQINHHLGLGVAGMVIADLQSVDGTTEYLAQYANDPRLVIRRFDESGLVDAQGMHMSEVWAWTLEAARRHFAPDWVVRLDADEFLMPQSADLERAFAAHEHDVATGISRYNAVFPSGPPEVFAGPRSYVVLAGQAVVAKPFPSDSISADRVAAWPMVFTQVLPKVAVRAGQVENFTTGGHGATNAQNVIDMPISSTLVIVHYWFTTLSRFQRKSTFMLDFERRFRRFMPPGAGWQWSRWAQIASNGPEAVSTEFARQFIDQDTFSQLRKDGIVRLARDLWSDMDG